VRKLLFSLLVLPFLASAAHAEVAAQFGSPWVQAPKDPNVAGLRFVLFNAANDSVRGFDVGMLSLSEAKRQSGVSMNWGIGKVTESSSGLASSFINLHSGVDTGLNAAFVNSVNTMKNGVNLAFINVSDGFSNIDISGIAISKQSTVQVGFLNVTSKLDGIQIGFLNFAENGFLPVFPFFNFGTK